MRISDWSSDVCSSDLLGNRGVGHAGGDLRRFGGQPVQRGAVDVADMHAGSRLAESARHGGADARCPGGDPDAQARGGRSAETRVGTECVINVWTGLWLFPLNTNILRSQHDIII